MKKTMLTLLPILFLFLSGYCQSPETKSLLEQNFITTQFPNFSSSLAFGKSGMGNLVAYDHRIIGLHRPILGQEIRYAPMFILTGITSTGILRVDYTSVRGSWFGFSILDGEKARSPILFTNLSVGFWTGGLQPDRDRVSLGTQFMYTSPRNRIDIEAGGLLPDDSYYIDASWVYHLLRLRNGLWFDIGLDIRSNRFIGSNFAFRMSAGRDPYFLFVSGGPVYGIADPELPAFDRTRSGVFFAGFGAKSF